jgi:MFS family permease
VLAAFAAACLGGYGFRSSRMTAPLIDLRIMRHQTFHVSVVGGLPLRLAVGALPFLMPLMFQLGFGLSPMDSGLLMVGSAAGALSTRAVLARVIGRYGFRSLLLGATLGSSASMAIYAGFTASTPHVLLFVALMLGGLVTSTVMVSLTALVFSEVPKQMQGQGTALSAMTQQLTFSLGVLLAAELLRFSVWRRDGEPSVLVAGDFALAFLFLAATVLAGLYFFRRLPADVGAEFRNG